MKKYRICLLLFFVWACNEDKSPIEPNQSEKQIVILYTNDEHGWMEETTYSEGCAKMMGLWREQESYSEDGPFLILSGGDNWTGPAISTWFKGESMVDVMNTMSYTATAIGNHEFDFNIEILLDRITQADFEFLSANIRDKSTDQIPDFALPYLITDVNGIKVGIIGLTTTTTPWSTFPANVQDYDFIAYDAALQQIVPQVKEEGADLLVVIGHICRQELQTLVPTAKDLDIAVMAGGHCHELFTETIDDVVLIEGGSYTASYAKVEIIYDVETQTIQDISHGTFPNQGGTADPAVEHVVTQWRLLLDQSLSDVIGYASQEINRYSPAMHNMVTDSWLYVYPTADVSLTNLGGIRQSIPAGNITLATIVGVLPFENSIVELELTGTQLINSIGNLLVGGMTTIGGYFLSDGTAIHADSMYQVLTTDYLYSRDDFNFSMYDPDPYNTSIHYRQPVIDWIQSLQTSSTDPLNNYLDDTPRK